MPGIKKIDPTWEIGIPCKIGGCGKPSVNSRGWCWTHYKRWRKHGDPTLTRYQTKWTLHDADVPVDLPTEYLAYVAGFFDGEGSLGIYVSRSGSTTFRATISQKKPFDGLLHELRDYFGGSLINSRRGQITCWQVTTGRAYRFLQSIFPYLRGKRPQAEIWMAFADDVRSGRYLDGRAADQVLRELKRVAPDL